MEKEKICGIYKITSPTGKVYIGQSINVLERWKKYKRLDCKSQQLLYNSFIKYGVESHSFEIIEECNFEEIFCRERYWQDIYDVLKRDKGMNLLLSECGTKKQETSLETREKRRNANTGENSHMFNKTGEMHHFYGKKHTEETKKKISESRKGKGMIKGKDNHNFGKKHTEETLQKKRDIMLTRYSNLDNPELKIVLDTQTGIFFYSIKEASKAYNLKYPALVSMLNGRRRNNTNLITTKNINNYE
jgi:group I intron endonuclease